jgi:alpha-beta hydrolase superfamily lysophospholipase
MPIPVVHDEGPVTDRVVFGPALYFRAVMPAPQPGREGPRAMVGLLHGYSDHGERFAHVMNAWAANGIGCVALDFRGHGRAAGARGHCTRFDEYKDDVVELTRLVVDRARGAPMFLFGHSFGALIAVASVLDTPAAWRGLVLSAPYLELAMRVSGAKVTLARALSRVAPRLAFASHLHGADVTRDAERARAYDVDPLLFPKVTVRWWEETRKAQGRVLARAPSLTSPLYVLFGTSDKVAEIAAGRAFFGAVSSQDKTWDERPGSFHEVLNDPGWEAVAADIARWVLARS